MHRSGRRDLVQRLVGAEGISHISAIIEIKSVVDIR